MSVKLKTFLAAAGLFTVCSTAASAQQFTNLLIYGDSLSDAGRLYAITGGTTPASPPYYQGRFSNGLVWVEQLAPKLGFTFNATTDFATGAAESGTGGPTGGVTAQLAGSALVPINASTLTVVWAGANDYLNNAATVPTATLVGRTVGNIVTAVSTVAARGGRTFLVPNLPDLGSTPGGVASGSSFNLSAITNIHNASLASSLRTLESATGARIVQLDVYGLIKDALANPARYGFTNTTVPCITPAGATGACATAAAAQATVFFDPIHPTTAAHAYVADFAVATLDEDYNGARVSAVPSYLGPLVVDTMREGVTDRLNVLRLTRDAGATPANGAYGAVKYAWGDRKDAPNVAAFDYKLTQITAGYDRAVSDSFVLGGSFSYSTGDAKLAGNRGKTDVTSYGFATYVGWRGQGVWVDLSGAAAGQTYDLVRNTGFTPRPTATASTKGLSYYAGLDVGMNLVGGDGFKAGPVAGVRYIYSRINAYTEQDAAMLGLSADRQKTDGVIGTIGAQASGTFTTGNTVIVPHARVIYQNELQQLDHTVVVTNSVGTPRTATGGTGNKDGVSIGAGLDVQATARLALSVDYLGTVSRSDGKDNSIMGRLVYAF